MPPAISERTAAANTRRSSNARPCPGSLNPCLSPPAPAGQPASQPGLCLSPPTPRGCLWQYLLSKCYTSGWGRSRGTKRRSSSFGQHQCSENNRDILSPKLSGARERAANTSGPSSRLPFPRGKISSKYPDQRKGHIPWTSAFPRPFANPNTSPTSRESDPQNHTRNETARLSENPPPGNGFRQVYREAIRFRVSPDPGAQEPTLHLSWKK
ncbi:uncharacterized protein LOC122547381 [Chiloscyllium plagiosum]|uniref:uncharacterized protein LOC122547381 n=1 Tax=Chiloscyllium plagiosum TaxID=36176 RepID=UPI001CB858A7|nr:uncharacterized protein LOC122547381 [Chiloscyllium plagiosum]